MQRSRRLIAGEASGLTTADRPPAAEPLAAGGLLPASTHRDTAIPADAAGDGIIYMGSAVEFIPAGGAEVGMMTWPAWSIVMSW